MDPARPRSVVPGFQPGGARGRAVQSLLHLRRGAGTILPGAPERARRRQQHGPAGHAGRGAPDRCGHGPGGSFRCLFGRLSSPLRRARDARRLLPAGRCRSSCLAALNAASRRRCGEPAREYCRRPRLHVWASSASLFCWVRCVHQRQRIPSLEPHVLVLLGCSIDGGSRLWLARRTGLCGLMPRQILLDEGMPAVPP